MRRRTESLAVARRDASPAPDIEGPAVAVEGRRGSGRVEVSEGVLDEDWGFVEAGWREEEDAEDVETRMEVHKKPTGSPKASPVKRARIA